MEVVNIQTLLPVGEKLKPLLNKSCISESDMKNILADRGVFIGLNSKKLSIPLLTLSILSPSEFEKLQQLQKTKEDSMKIRSSKITSVTDNNLNDVIPLDIISPEAIITPTDTYKFNSDLNFSMDNNNKIVLDYEVVREDITKDWACCESKYTGRVEVSKDLTAHAITFKSEFTSTETENVNHKVIGLLLKYLKDQNEIVQTDVAYEITSDKFINQERFSFMLQLANDSDNGLLIFEAVKNIEIGPDRNHPLPENAKWMEDCVKNIIINSEKGETLGNVEYISNKEYHESLILREIQAQFKFKIGLAEGRCIIEYGFPHYFRTYSRGYAFEVSVHKIYFSKNSKSQNIKTTSRAILNEFELTYQKVFNNIKQLPTD